MLRFRWFIPRCALSTCCIQSMAISAEDTTSHLQEIDAVVGSGDATRTITVPHRVKGSPARQICQLTALRVYPDKRDGYSLGEAIFPGQRHQSGVLKEAQEVSREREQGISQLGAQVLQRLWGGVCAVEEVKVL